MNSKKIVDYERSKIERWSQFQLKHQWKVRGVVISLAVILTLIALKFIATDYQWLKFGLKKALLLGLLMVSLSQEKMEDEMIVSLRSKSYTLAFVFAVLYALVQPIVNIVVFKLFSSNHIDAGFSYFQVLSFMLIIQISFFEVLKRYR